MHSVTIYLQETIKTTASVAGLIPTPIMRTCHGALLLAVAMMLLSTGICTAPAPAPGPGLNEFPPEYAPAPGLGMVVFPPEHSCRRILYSGGCNGKTCHNKCFSQLKGDGLCAGTACQCSYLCNPPPLDI